MIWEDEGPLSERQSWVTLSTGGGEGEVEVSPRLIRTSQWPFPAVMVGLHHSVMTPRLQDSSGRCPRTSCVSVARTHKALPTLPREAGMEKGELLAAPVPACEHPNKTGCCC